MRYVQDEGLYIPASNLNAVDTATDAAVLMATDPIEVLRSTELLYELNEQRQHVVELGRTVDTSKVGDVEHDIDRFTNFFAATRQMLDQLAGGFESDLSEDEGRAIEAGMIDEALTVNAELSASEIRQIEATSDAEYLIRSKHIGGFVIPLARYIRMARDEQAGPLQSNQDTAEDIIELDQAVLSNLSPESSVRGDQVANPEDTKPSTDLLVQRAKIAQEIMLLLSQADEAQE